MGAIYAWLRNPMCMYIHTMILPCAVYLLCMYVGRLCRVCTYTEKTHACIGVDLSRSICTFILSVAIFESKHTVSYLSRPDTEYKCVSHVQVVDPADIQILYINYRSSICGKRMRPVHTLWEILINGVHIMDSVSVEQTFCALPVWMHVRF